MACFAVDDHVGAFWDAGDGVVAPEAAESSEEVDEALQYHMFSVFSALRSVRERQPAVQTERQ